MILQKLTPLSEFFKTSSAYWGERSDWLVVYAVNRDSDCLARSNFRTIARKLNGGKGDFKSFGKKGSEVISENLVIEEASHWACGWIQYLIINPNSELVKDAEAILAKLDGYPVYDESDFSELETEEADRIWKTCYNAKDRIEYIRKSSSGEFSFSSFADLLGCCRGKYFAGYASELLG